MSGVIGHTSLKASDATELTQYQRALRALPPVFAVYIRCDGEDSLENLYATEETARFVMNRINEKPSYYGRARVLTHRVITPEVHAILRWNRTDENRLTSGDQS